AAGEELHRHAAPGPQPRAVAAGQQGRRGRGRHREVRRLGQPQLHDVPGLPFRHRRRQVAEGRHRRRRLERQHLHPGGRQARRRDHRGARPVRGGLRRERRNRPHARLGAGHQRQVGDHGRAVRRQLRHPRGHHLRRAGDHRQRRVHPGRRPAGRRLQPRRDGQDPGRARGRAGRRGAPALMPRLDSAGAAFRAALAAESPLQVMGAITAYAGLMAMRTGYKALYLSGGGVAANSLGMPDLGISTMEDVLTDARRIVDATGMPLLVDIDTGWGGAFNIGRTIRNFERIGVAAVHMEDQVGQKRCGHRPGKEVVPAEEMVDRVKAAVDARNDEAFVIMARTDAAAVEGIDGAIERAVAYVEAGADMIFPEAMKTLDDYRRFKAAVKVPILANLTEFGSTPFFTTDELRDAGVDIALYCCGAYRAMNKAALHFYETVRREGTQKNIVDTLQTRAELYDFL